MNKLVWLGASVAVVVAVALAARGSGTPGREAASPAAAPGTPAATGGTSATGSGIMGDLKFSHDLHTDDLELECTECHHETHAQKLDLAHPEYFEDFWIDCQICHNTEAVQEAQACSNCHHSNLEDIADETRSAKVVLHQSCWSCHELHTGAEASAGCETCHEGSEGHHE